MASNWLYIDTNFPTFTGEESTEEKVSTIQNYMFMLVEQLRYTLHNLDLTNMNAAAVAEHEDSLTSPIYAAIRDADENIAQLAVTAAGIASRVSDAEGNISTLQQTASSIASVVSDQSGQISALVQTVEGFTLHAQNGSESSTISLRSGGVVISSATISFSGVVTFSDLSTSGATVINGGNIRTGVITADNIGLRNRFSLLAGELIYGYMGCGYGDDGRGQTFGAMLSDTSGNNYVIVTNSGARLTAKNSSIYCISGGVHATSEIIIDSDRRVKEDIDYDLERYEPFFLRLKPCIYHRKGEAEARYHTGFIAQEVEEALSAAGLTYADLAALTKDPYTNPEYGLRYGEFAALNAYMIQRLAARIDALERRTA